jgi:hypothetical protein
MAFRALVGVAVLIGLFGTSSRTALAQARTTVSLDASHWEATDSVRSATYLGRPSLYINKGTALSRDAAMENGTIDYDVATSPSTSFLGIAFRGASPRFTEVLLLRPGLSGSIEALQYAPAFNGLAAAWQIYHGDESNASVTIAREKWIHVRIELDGPTARVFFDTATVPTLVVPRLAGAGGQRIGVWTGAYGRGAYFSSITYTLSTASSVARDSAPAAKGVITNWELSNTVDATSFSAGVVPKLAGLTWQRVNTEPEGFVLVNRYRDQPMASLPVDPQTHEALVDSIMSGRIAGAKMVYARAVVDSPRDERRRLRFVYSDGVAIFANGVPVSFAMNPQGFRDDLGIMAKAGDAAYLPLKAGRNELVFAVIEVGGGWAFGATLDPKD